MSINQINNEEILKLVIEKAKKNGWESGGIIAWLDSIAHELSEDMPAKDVDRVIGQTSFIIIFDEGFAKAFWGEGVHANFITYGKVEHNTKCKHCGGRCTWHGAGQEEVEEFEFVPRCWQYQLQQMVLEKEPIKYLEQFIR